MTDGDRTRAVYDAKARAYDAARSQSLVEKPWLDRFLALVPEGGSVLDLGCGMGEPIGAYILAQRRRLTGLDFAPALLAMARARLPAGAWIEGDIRTLDLGRAFDGVLSWDGFFHLTQDEQRAAPPRIAAHVRAGGPLLLTVGPRECVSSGQVAIQEDEAEAADHAVAHASLSIEEYRTRLAACGIEVLDFVAQDPACGGRSVILARKG